MHLRSWASSLWNKDDKQFFFLQKLHIYIVQYTQMPIWPNIVESVIVANTGTVLTKYILF